MEIVGNLVDKAIVDRKNTTVAPRVMDMGCGRGYLTFSLHSYLHDKFKTVQSVGIDLRPKLVREMNEIAQSLGAEFEGATFEMGSIEDVMLEGSNGEDNFENVVSGNKSSDSINDSSHLDILIALHACDTATDDALWCGICRLADVIVVAPCCHKQVRPQLNNHLRKSSELGGGNNHPLAAMLRHNVYRERQAEMVTDSVRALLLELAGYQVQVFEFIGGEHTAKNVMITATRRKTAIDAEEQRLLQSRLEDLTSLHGIKQQKLAQWMGPSFLGDSSPLLSGSYQEQQSGTLNTGKLSGGRMPPLSRPF